MSNPLRQDRLPKDKKTKRCPAYIREKYGLDRRGKGKNGELSLLQASHILAHRPEPTLREHIETFIAKVFGYEGNLPWNERM
jgi:hypothetical protein